MSIYTDWFLAEEEEAETVASIGSDDEDDASFEDWPHLAMKRIGDSELMLLYGILLGKPGEMESIDGAPLYMEIDEEDEGGVSVSRVLPEFLDALVTIPANEPVAEEWSRTENMSDWEVPDIMALLTEIVEFARRSQQESMPVLQLSTW